MCLTDRGCPIRELAEDIEINRVCAGFIDAKKLDSFKGYESKKVEALNRADITDPDLIYELESVWLEFENKLLNDRKAYGKQ